ncbi:MAG TPA: hypothetical protein VJS38_08190 [Phenylobacterium sp.]|uniref:hypothetical protein n=1 Tax=Phenylobacterium sp. TaxID=1871053 RepID=UPI002B48D540|nr:hypothetical protein [Phenylobacterium sp.]HKR88143.1 hypothetical protein [Phenylobacterium sp.]
MSRQTPPDASMRIALIGIVAVLATAVLGLLVAAGVSRLFDRSAIPAAPLVPAAPPAPQLEVRGGGDLAQVRARAQAKLSTYGWTDPGHAAARIPLDRALAITAQRGWSDPEPAR